MMVASALMELPEVSAADLPDEPWGDWLLTRVGSALDGTMLQAMRFVVDAALMPQPDELPKLRASAAPFLSGELWDEPRRFFSFIDEAAVPEAVSGRYRRSVDGGAIISRQFAVAYQPYCNSQAVADAPSTGTEKVLVEHWMHEPDRGRGTVIALHGFSMGYPRMDAFALFAPQFFRQGIDVALITLPFHGPRTPPDARFSGERFAVPHVARLNEAVRQAIYEVHIVVNWIRQQTRGAVGLLGLSLGGYLTALMAGLTAELDFVIPMVPPVCMGDLAWRFFTHSRRYRSGAPAYTREELRAGYRVHSPLSYTSRVDRARMLIVAGRGDQIVPVDHPYALWRHWDEPDICWFSGSHLAPFRRGRLFARILEHVERCAHTTRSV